MGKRHPNHRLAKIHRNYTVEEAASLFGVHRNTIRQWIKRGLPTIDANRPTLILGRELAGYLQARRAKNKRPCKPGEIYCVRCREPKPPAGGLAELRELTGNSANLAGICPSCNTMMYRRVNVTKLPQIRGDLEVITPQALRHIDETGEPSVNSDLREE